MDDVATDSGAWKSSPLHSIRPIKERIDALESSLQKFSRIKRPQPPTEQELKETPQETSLAWTPMVNLGNPFGTRIVSLSVALQQDGRLMIASVDARGGNKTVKTIAQTAPNSNQWEPAWTTVPFPISTGINVVSVSRQGDGKLVMSGVADDFTLSFTQQTAPNASSWNSWKYLGRDDTSYKGYQVANILDDKNILHAIGGSQALSGHVSYCDQLPPNSSSWSRWMPIGSTPTWSYSIYPWNFLGFGSGIYGVFGHNRPQFPEKVWFTRFNPVQGRWSEYYIFDDNAVKLGDVIAVTDYSNLRLNRVGNISPSVDNRAQFYVYTMDQYPDFQFVVFYRRQLGVGQDSWTKWRPISNATLATPAFDSGHLASGNAVVFMMVKDSGGGAQVSYHVSYVIQKAVVADDDLAFNGFLTNEWALGGSSPQENFFPQTQIGSYGLTVTNNAGGGAVVIAVDTSGNVVVRSEHAA